MSKLRQIMTRARASAVIWSWAFNGLRLASGLILLPLLARHLARPEFGMYYVFLSLSALLPFLDLGISGTIGRFVGYAMAGATRLQSQGFVAPEQGGSPNYPLLWSLLRSTRSLYLYIAVFGVVIMGLWGTLLVHSRVHETANPSYTWIAWAVTLLAAGVELYSYWWNNFLYYANRVRESARVAFNAYLVRTVLACVLLIAGAGLLSVAAASLVGSMLNVIMARRFVLAAIGHPPAEQPSMSRTALLKLAWPNSWRLAMMALANYLRANANTQLCVALFGLDITAQYGLTVQVINIASGMALVWTTVKWPMAAQLRSMHDLDGVHRLLRPRLWLQLFTFVVLSLGAVILVPPLFRLLHTDKQMLPLQWGLVLALVGLLEVNFVFWGSLLALENRIPTLRSALATTCFSLLLSYVLAAFTSLGVFALVISPLLSGMLFLYWYWPREGARSLGYTWTSFMFGRTVSGATR